MSGIFAFISFGLILTFIYHISQGDDIVIRRVRAKEISQVYAIYGGEYIFEDFLKPFAHN